MGIPDLEAVSYPVPGYQVEGSSLMDMEATRLEEGLHVGFLALARMCRVKLPCGPAVSRDHGPDRNTPAAQATEQS